MIEEADLRHVIPGVAVYFVLKRELDRETFLWALQVLESRRENVEGSATAEDHWQALQSRMAGKSRWDAVIPRLREHLEFVEATKQMRERAQTVENILRCRPYVGCRVEGLHYTLDVFNPRNELEMPYRGAGEPVLALLIQGVESEPGPITNRLVENQAFYAILRDLDGILNPEHVCGHRSLMSLLCAYLEGRVDPSYRPWEFLFPLQVLGDPPIPLTPETRISGALVGMLPGKEVKLAKVEDWGAGRVLIQIRPGLDAVIGWEYFAVAKALGMTPVQQLVEGSAPPRTAAR